jgi:cytochrome c553
LPVDASKPSKGLIGFHGAGGQCLWAVVSDGTRLLADVDRAGDEPLMLAAPAVAGDVAAGRRKALACQACHGLDGLSKLPDAPHLAGQPERYLVKSLDEYRKGVRRNELMTLVVKDLSDQDIADLASYYGAIEISAQPPK